MVSLGSIIKIKPSVAADFERTISWLDSFDPITREPSILSPAVRAMGAHLLQNFHAEGGIAGRKWQNLSEMTNDVREQRGHPREHPILFQYGHLYEAAIKPFSAWSVASLSSKVSRPGAALNANMQSRLFTATVTGPKVENQYGGLSRSNFFGFAPYATGTSANRYGIGYLPPRPFWYLSDSMVTNMTHALMNRVYMDWSIKGAVITGMVNPSSPALTGTVWRRVR